MFLYIGLKWVENIQSKIRRIELVATTYKRALVSEVDKISGFFTKYNQRKLSPARYTEMGFQRHWLLADRLNQILNDLLRFEIELNSLLN